MAPPARGPETAFELRTKFCTIVNVGQGTRCPTQAAAAAAAPPPLLLTQGLPALPQEWHKDHEMFVSALQDLAGELAALEAKQSPSQLPRSGASGQPAPDIMERVMEQAPSSRLRAFLIDRKASVALQRQLPEQLDQNMRLLTVLAAEMKQFVQQLERLAELDADRAQPAAGSQPVGNEPASLSSDEALLLATVVDGLAKETHLIVSALPAAILDHAAKTSPSKLMLRSLNPRRYKQQRAPRSPRRLRRSPQQPP